MPQWAAQRSRATFPGRYDKIFSRLGAQVARRTGHRPAVLSFGCSSGAEIADLDRHLPGSRLFGCDVDRMSLEAAERTCVAINPRLFFSNSRSLKVHGPFDVVTAMSVLVRYPEIHNNDSISDIYPFADFDRVISEIAHNLAENGILALYNSCYSLPDSSVASQFAPIDLGEEYRNGWIDKYAPNGFRLTECLGIVDEVPIEGVGWRVPLQSERLNYVHVPIYSLPASAMPDTRTVLWRKIASG